MVDVTEKNPLLNIETGSKIHFLFLVPDKPQIWQTAFPLQPSVDADDWKQSLIALSITVDPPQLLSSWDPGSDKALTPRD